MPFNFLYPVKPLKTPNHCVITLSPESQDLAKYGMGPLTHLVLGFRIMLLILDSAILCLKLFFSFFFFFWESGEAGNYHGVSAER